MRYDIIIECICMYISINILRTSTYHPCSTELLPGRRSFLRLECRGSSGAVSAAGRPWKDGGPNERRQPVNDKNIHFWHFSWDGNHEYIYIYTC